MAHTMHVISHTHWDREWYLTFQQFRMRLVDLIDNLLDLLDADPDFKYFNLDGQTIVLEDYLEIRPQNESRLRKYIEEGRILVGPWYQLNDEFLVSGESTIRSLLIGHRIARDFGGIMKVGYLPDQFGNISQMPQIFREFGIDNCIFGRGLQLTDGRKMEFVWEGADGSTVLASLMAFWYNNAQRFPADTEQAVAYTRAILERMSPVAATDQLLLMNGVDHLEAQTDLSDILRRVNERLGEDRLVHSTLPKYIEAVKSEIEREGIELQRIHGELREDRHGSILAGTLSSRVYLKQANHESETWLTDYAEPSASFAWMLGKEYPSDFLNYAWKLLMQNHPHDSICGCSLDQVHDEMMPRFAQVNQIAEEITHRSLDYIASRVQTDADSLVVFNPLNWTRTDRITAEIEFPISDTVRDRPIPDYSRDVAAIEIFDPAGKSVPYKLLDRSIHAKQVLSSVELPMSVMVRRFTVEFVAEDVPACGYKTFTVRRVARAPRFDCSSVTQDIRQPFRFDDGGDVGDEYRYVRPLQDRVVTTEGSSPQMEIIDHGPVSSTVCVRWNMKLPVSATPDCRGRAEETVDCPVTSWITRSDKSPRIDVVTEVGNYAKDHRLRVVIPTSLVTDVVHADGHFDVVTRPIRPPAEWEDAAPYYPMRAWVDLNDGNQGLALINKGLREFEVLADKTGNAIAVTLLRCVGRLSGGGDTPTAIPTPGAQCIGKYRFEYAILPHRGSWQNARVWEQARQHNVPLIYRQTGAHEGDLPPETSFVVVTPSELVVSAIKKAEERDSLLVRLYNITDEIIHQGQVKVADAVSCHVVNLNEEPSNELVMETDGSVLLDVLPKKIVTLEFRLRR